jgi:hypothetical protein
VGFAPLTGSVTDIDGDGTAELVIADSGASKVTTVQNDSGTYQAILDHPTGKAPVALAVSCVNGDG